MVQNLIQSCPGAKKCNGYKWVKFEVNKNLTMDSMPILSEDPTISHAALKLKMAGLYELSIELFYLFGFKSDQHNIGHTAPC